MNLVLLLVRLGLSLLLLRALLSGLADPARLRTTLREAGWPTSLVPVVGLLLPLLELTVVVALLPAASAWWDTGAALVLALLGVAAIGSLMARRRSPHDRSLDPRRSASQGWLFPLIQDLVLAALAAVVVAFGRTTAAVSAVTWLGQLWTAEPLALVSLVLVPVALLAGGWLVWQLLSQQGRLLLRLEALEKKSGEGEGAVGQQPQAGRPVAIPAPVSGRALAQGEEDTAEAMVPKQKVFGLGLNKTGTTSLTLALVILGYRAIHFPMDRVTQIEFYRFFATGSESIHLSVLEEHDALTDTPVCCLYQALDRAYPGSKFVLTVREKQAWLPSYHLLWEQLAPLRGAASNGLQAHYFRFINDKLYGTQGAEPELLSHAYDRYTAEVLAYFRKRPQDLLILDICGGEGWSKLAPFLGVPLPQVPFPWKHRAPKQKALDDGNRGASERTERQFQEA